MKYVLRNNPATLEIEEMNFFRYIYDNKKFYNITREGMYPLLEFYGIEPPHKILSIDQKDMIGTYVSVDAITISEGPYILGRHIAILLSDKDFKRQDIDVIKEKVKKVGYAGINVFRNIQDTIDNRTLHVIDFVTGEQMSEFNKIYDRYCREEFNKVPIWFGDKEMAKALFDNLFGNYMREYIGAEVDYKDYYPFGDKFPTPGFMANSEILFIASNPPDFMKKVKDTSIFRDSIGISAADSIYGPSKMPKTPHPVVWRKYRDKFERWANDILEISRGNEIKVIELEAKDMRKLYKLVPELRINIDMYELEEFKNPKLIFTPGEGFSVEAEKGNVKLVVKIDDINIAEYVYRQAVL